MWIPSRWLTGLKRHVAFLSFLPRDEARTAGHQVANSITRTQAVSSPTYLTGPSPLGTRDA